QLRHNHESLEIQREGEAPAEPGLSNRLPSRLTHSESKWLCIRAPHFFPSPGTPGEGWEGVLPANTLYADRCGPANNTVVLSQQPPIPVTPIHQRIPPPHPRPVKPLPPRIERLPKPLNRTRIQPHRRNPPFIQQHLLHRRPGPFANPAIDRQH